MISVIIPVYNEEKKLPELLRYLEETATNYISEIIVVDGGSTDNTRSLAETFKEILFIQSEKGRAVQMNAGASVARAEILYFLHADSIPPKHFDELIVAEVKNGNNAGCFQMRFDKDHWWLNFIGLFTRINHLSCRGGDQSLFVEKKLFQKIGGYDESYKVYEDNELIRRLYAQGQFVVIKKWITTSARLYEKLGIWKTQWLFLEIHWKRRFGASAEELYSHYYKRLNS